MSLQVNEETPLESENLIDSLRSLARSGWIHYGSTMDAETADQRSAQPFVVSLEKRVFPVDCRYRQSVQQIVSSLLWVFVARLSSSEKWITIKDQGRMVRSARQLAQRIQKLEHTAEQKYVKFWLDKLLAKLVSDRNPYPLPKKEFKEPLFSGFLLRIVQRRLAHRDAGFIYSLQRGAKLAWPKLPNQCLVDTLNAHRDAICRYPTPIGAKMVTAIATVSHEVFSSIKSDDLTKFCPSNSACYEFSRKDYGTAACFKGLEHPAESGMGLLKDYHNALNSIRSTEFDRFQTLLTEKGLELSAKVVAIPEPGKFRIISKGSGFLYSALQPLQGAMLNCWKKHSASTMLSSDLTPRIIDLNSRRPPGFNLWASVDYSSATDLLKRSATMAALKGIPIKNWREFAKSAFGQGPLIYPNIYDEEDVKKVIFQGGTFLQGEGQLMGHPLSFPLLCVINLACYREAVERWIEEADWESSEYDERRNLWFQIRDLVITNGDDMLFPTCQRLYDIFCEVVKEVGFKLSAGKNYLSDEYALINSQLFHISGKNVTRIGYLNQRLMLGQCLKSGSSGALPTQIAKAAEQMVKLTSWTRCAIPMIMKRWTRRGQFVPNWYLPVHLGGYGLSPCLAPSTWKVSQTQRKMAARFVREPTLALYRVKEMRHGTSESLDRSLKKFEQLSRKYAPKAIWEPDDGSVKEEKDSEQEFDRWADRFAYITMWARCKSSLDERENLPRRLSVIRNLKPMGIEGFRKYWNRKLIPVVRAPCPPLLPMRLRMRFRYRTSATLVHTYVAKGPVKGSMGSHPVIAQIVEFSCPYKSGPELETQGKDLCERKLDAEEPVKDVMVQTLVKQLDTCRKPIPVPVEPRPKVEVRQVPGMLPPMKKKFVKPVKLVRPPPGLRGEAGIQWILRDLGI